MKCKIPLLLPVLFIISVFNLTIPTGCANIIPPMGGPRDSIPPVLISVTPVDSSRHITPKKIVFNFNEYIDGKDIHDNLIVSPVPKIDPLVDSKLRTVTIEIKDTLQPNTTYSFDFGRGVKDVNEGNVLKHLEYVFTTGNHIDSSELSGNVILAATGKTDSTLIVVLHAKHDDSAVVNDRPRYMTRLDSLGHFAFRYLQPGTYSLYAMKDEGGTRRYLSKSQLFAFADSPVAVGPAVQPITLYAYVDKTDTKPVTKTPSTSGRPAGSKPSEKGKDKEKEKRLFFQTSATGGELDVLDSFRITFSSSLQTFDTSKIRFTSGDFNDIDPRQYSFLRDSTNKKFTLMYRWPTDTKYNLILAKEAVKDSAGTQLLKIDTISFHTKKETDYGEVRLRFARLDLSKHPVLQFVQGDAVKFSYPFTTRAEFRTRIFQPGEYELRILYDENGNGVWDSGEFFGKHRQPEKVRPVLNIRGGKLNVKPNWDNDVDINL